jgi:hypothetical protein
VVLTRLKRKCMANGRVESSPGVRHGKQRAHDPFTDVHKKAEALKNRAREEHERNEDSAKTNCIRYTGE